MQIIKKDNSKENFDRNILKQSINEVFSITDNKIDDETIEKITNSIESTLKNKYPRDYKVNIEDIKDLVKLELIENRFFEEVKKSIKMT